MGLLISNWVFIICFLLLETFVVVLFVMYLVKKAVQRDREQRSKESEDADL